MLKQAIQIGKPFFPIDLLNDPLIGSRSPRRHPATCLTKISKIITYQDSLLQKDAKRQKKFAPTFQANERRRKLSSASNAAHWDHQRLRRPNLPAGWTRLAWANRANDLQASAVNAAYLMKTIKLLEYPLVGFCRPRELFAKTFYSLLVAPGVCSS